MPKELELEVKCPQCGWEMKYHSYNKSSELEGDRRMSCKKCGRSFKVLDQRIGKQHNTRENDDRPFGWQKFSKK